MTVFGETYDLIQIGLAAMGVIVVALVVMLLYGVGRLAERIRRHFAKIRIQREVMTAAAEFVPKRRPTAHCPVCGRFAKRTFECHGVEETLCKAHGVEWRLEKLVGDFERPIDVVVDRRFYTWTPATPSAAELWEIDARVNRQPDYVPDELGLPVFTQPLMIEEFEVLDDHGEPLVLGALPHRRAVRGRR